MRAILFLFLLGGCDDDAGMPTDMAVLQAGQQCLSGIGGPAGTCATGLKCCVVPWQNGPFDGGCLDTPSACEPVPPPAGYHDCF
jgi:hypothetical protein